MGQRGGGGHGDGAVDGLFLGPVWAGDGEVLGVGVAVGDELVLEVLDDVAALAVELQHAARAGDPLHGLADVVVVAHPAGALLVGHEHLEGLEPHLHGLGQGAQDGGAVLQDEMEAEVHDGRGVDLLADAIAGLHQCLIAVEGVVGEGDERGHACVCCGPGAEGVVVVAVEVDVGVDEAGEDELALCVDDAVGGRQEMLGGHGHDLVALDRHGGVKDLGRRYDLSAANDGVDSRL